MNKLSDFDYDLPKELIAQYPAESRDSSRMLVLDRRSGKITHGRFSDFPGHVKKEDILVLNNTKVMNVRLVGRRLTGGRTEIFLTEKIENRIFKALLKPSSRIRERDEVIFDGSKLKARILAKKEGENVVEFIYPGGNIDQELGRIGSVPLPPYIKRNAEALDKDRYQTVYAKEDGAAAAPTAGLHFTDKVLEEIGQRGVKTAYVTLHVNYGTFAPVKTEDITRHKMHGEEFRLGAKEADDINAVKKCGGRVFAVGTTSVRVLETCARGNQVEQQGGKTDIFIYPPYKFKIVDVLLTNFHFPKSTLLMLVSAFAGRELVLKAYKEAIRERYRFFSYGDCMLIM
ncbi:MAG: tRNA preQ1(34) S-adenosylmethionine ribosyltransferase-isomerase QueA [Candidatus Omnitrophica bacterium]|nr:tRNA preQ1(34) S-adenosylmethionine ribosyltransferase-isomerase QueA [Candidatus Omnitrophota bacterium]MBU4487756.1 tRNA preQ1(34) S-adenosylmethionine ribosyltransferase-isomerase QueA [Candidatus Omnitrophota bacterium]MCG2705714.1 tRNA preQ1(34) S-adenosylmethionine ribosyltransferase-isomerase QueA [Candidatus Omnitrophota bacterium]